MIKQKHSRYYEFMISVLLVIALAFLFSCGEKPTSVVKKSGDSGFTGSGEINPGAGGSFLLGTASDPSYAPGRIEVWANNVAFDSSSGIVSFDVRLGNATVRTIQPPIYFVITSIVPYDIAVMEFDGVSDDGFPFYDFSGKLGVNGILDPGEISGFVTMKFHTVEPRSFSVGFRIDIGPPYGTGMIAGVVFLDENKNGIRDGGGKWEPGIPEITVSLEKRLSSGEIVHLLTRTDNDGNFSYSGLKEGVYKIYVRPSPEDWEITSDNPLLVTLVKGPDGDVRDFLEAAFGLYPEEPQEPETLFGPITMGPYVGRVLLDTTFVNTPSVLPVQYLYYYLSITPPTAQPVLSIIDSAAAWINDQLVFGYTRTLPPDTAWFPPQVIKLPNDLVKYGENTIRLFTEGNNHAELEFWLYKQP